MRNIIAIALAALAIIWGTPSHSIAQTFEAPKYAKGTIFTLLKTTWKGKKIHRVLIYRGTNTSFDRRYDFGRFTLSSTLVFANKKRNQVSKRIGIKFPFSVGSSWKYEYYLNGSSSGNCDRVKRSFDVTVAKSMHKVTVAGRELDVVGIHHEGRWECGEGEGKFTYDYEYSPLLGMYVSEIWKNFRPNGDVWREGEKKLVDYVIPNPVKVSGPLTGSYLTAEELKKLYSGALVITHTKAKSPVIYAFRSDGTYVRELFKSRGIKKFPRRKWRVKAPDKICIQYKKLRCYRHKRTATGYDRYRAKRDKILPKLWVISKGVE